MTFTLQILHASDFEGGIDAAGTTPQTSDAVKFSAVINRLRTNTDTDTFGVSETVLANTLTLSSGDNFIPGVFLNASSDTSLNGVGGLGASSAPVIGRGDIGILNALGIQASVLGNHEFDLGVRQVRDILRVGGGNPGTNFPYLSANIDFSPEIFDPVTNPDGAIASSDLAENQDTAEASTITQKIAKSTVITLPGNDGILDTEDDQVIGIVGATTPLLPVISSPGRLGISPENSVDYETLAAIIQSQVEILTAQGINKIVLLTHLQQLDIDVDQLAPRLRDVDVIVAGGSHTILADDNDILRAGDTAGDIYPIVRTAADSQPILVVNTEANYQYVGRLVATFDENGIIELDSLDPLINGAYATNQAGVDRVYGLIDFDAASDITEFTTADANTEHQKIVDITTSIRNVIASKDNLIVGKASVFLNGTRNDVRTRETNFGNLTADANLWQAQQVDPTVVISLKNGGGIRDNIGAIDGSGGAVDASGAARLPTQPSALAPNKEVGDISQLDVENSLRFNNSLSLITVTAEQLKLLLEHGVASTAPGRTPGQFPQVSGINFSFDPTQRAIAFDNNGNVTQAGERIQDLTVVNEDGSPLDVVVRNGQLVGDANRTFRMVTLNFLAGTAISAAAPGLGGDGYPFPKFVQDNAALANRVDLRGETTDVNGNGVIDAPLDLPQGVFDFAPAGSEQDAFAEYMTAVFGENRFSIADQGFRPDQPRTINLSAGETSRNADNSLTVESNGNLRVTIDAVNSDRVNEIGVFVVDDQENRVNGIAPGEQGYLQAALNRGQVVFSAIANNPNGYDPSELSRILTGLNNNSRLVFYLVENSTTDAVLAGDNANVFFGTNNGNAAQVSDLDNGNFQIAWRDQQNNSNFNNLIVTVANTNETKTLGTRLQGQQERELIDLRGLDGLQVQAEFTVNREAAFDNFVGFYQVVNPEGGIDVNGDGNADILPGQAGYVQAAVRGRVAGIDLRVANQGTANFTGQFTGGNIFAPFIISNGTVDQVLNGQTSEVYVPYLGANPGGVDHIRLLGDNTFGFEDLPGGGDLDYNDMIVRVNLSIAGM
ncbi:5'-nucleotidase C-terminal domain-containing protein [Nodularia chucula]|uniref:5'-nucleotidase C-terminal domain-containing protein n=1 Tax=Nodularia chucula TaxID=3093667 RepID=UPI0039C6AA93